MDSKQLLSAIVDAFAELEALSLRVGYLILQPEEYKLLESEPEVFDRETHREILDHFTNPFFGEYKGVAWGAQVFCGVNFEKGHIVCLPEMEFMSKPLGSPEGSKLWESIKRSRQ